MGETKEVEGAFGLADIPPLAQGYFREEFVEFKSFRTFTISFYFS